ncbi:MAG: hypothetical protein K2X71_24280 [Methylobacterium sp.]|uniref:hypothetical protein n=1 Tax=Methylobacterium sp. TaxID=409 RepID=UPI002589F459|nr:hypothetical protein [Methylobacterium sp.]MBY0299114.1 hypothetical protein [Methylobacterium sp.]
MVEMEAADPAMPPPRCSEVVLADFGQFFEEQSRKRHLADDPPEEGPAEPLTPEDLRRVSLLKGLAAEVLTAAAAQLGPHGVLVETGPSLKGRPDFEQAYTQFMLINRHSGRASPVYVMSITDTGYFLASACDPQLDHDLADRQLTHCAASELTCEVMARVVKDAILHVV